MGAYGTWHSIRTLLVGFLSRIPRLASLAATLEVSRSFRSNQVVEARNDLLRSALDNFPELTHVLFVDADMTFTVEDYVKLVCYNFRG